MQFLRSRSHAVEAILMVAPGNSKTDCEWLELSTRALIFKAPYIVSTAVRRPAKTFFLFESWGYVASDAGGQFYLRFHRSVVVGMPRRQRQNRLLGRPLRSTRSSLLWRPLRPRGSQLTLAMWPLRPRKIRPRKSSMLGGRCDQEGAS